MLPLQTTERVPLESRSKWSPTDGSQSAKEHSDVPVPGVEPGALRRYQTVDVDQTAT
jgi:hypothetical protein